MYDWWIGGKDNFASDREMGRQFERAIPGMRAMARENRNFMHRVVRYLADAGIDQFLDIGTGIPTSPNVHEIAQRSQPEARVVYLDNDPIVLTHARALLVSGDRGSTTYIDADIREPEAILANPSLTGTLDLDRPVGLLMIAILMLLRDEEDPWGKVRRLMDGLPSGSYLAITHPGHDFNPAALAAAVAAATAGGVVMVPRTRADVERFFEGWELVDPGVVPVMTWRPDGELSGDPNSAYYWSGLARKR